MPQRKIKTLTATIRSGWNLEESRQTSTQHGVSRDQPETRPICGVDLLCNFSPADVIWGEIRVAT